MLGVAVESVLSQAYRPIEVIISDDGSTDDTIQVALTLQSRHPGIIKVVTGDAQGAGPAREAGRKLASGEFIQYLDSDDILLPDKFRIQVSALNSHPKCGAAYGYIRIVDASGVASPAPFKETGVRHETLFPRLMTERWWNTDCPLFRRSVTDQVGAWSDLRYSQDWEYDARVGALKTKLVHCPQWVCEQRTHTEARQTGHGGWLSPGDRVRFLTSLYRCGIAGGVTHDMTEMKKFSRWVFFHARYCGLAGDEDAALRLYELAVESAGFESMDMRVFSAFARRFGWSRSARWAESARSLVRRSLGYAASK